MTSRSHNNSNIMDDAEVSTEDELPDTEDVSAGLANMPDELLEDLSEAFERLHDPNNFDHLSIEEQLKKFKHRDLRVGRLYQIAKKFFRGSMRPRRRVYNAPGGYLPHVDRRGRSTGASEQLTEGQPSFQVTAKKSHSPDEIVAIEKQEKIEKYKKWLSDRKSLRNSLDKMGLDLNWLLNKNRTPLEERMLQEILDKIRRKKPAPPPEVVFKLKEAVGPPPAIHRPVPHLLYHLDKHLRVNRIRLVDFFQMIDRDKTWDISREEMSKAFEVNNFTAKQEHIDEVFVCFDKDCNDYIDYRELAEAMTLLRLEQRQIRRRIASSKTLHSDDWDSIFSPSSPLGKTGSPRSDPESSPHSPCSPIQLQTPAKDFRKEQYILSSDEAMVDLRKRDKEALKKNIKLASKFPSQPGDPDFVPAPGVPLLEEKADMQQGSTRLQSPPFKTGRGPTKSPEWFPEHLRTAGRNTFGNKKEQYPDEITARPFTLSDERYEEVMSTRSGLLKESSNLSTGKQSPHRLNSPNRNNRKMSPKRGNSPNTLSGKASKVSIKPSGTRMIKTGVKGIDSHMRPSTLGGETGDMVDKFRQLKLKEYYEIIKLCKQEGMTLNEKLFQKVLLHPPDKTHRELTKKIRQPANPLLSKHFADPPERARTPTAIRHKGKLKRSKTGDILINTRHLYKTKEKCSPQVEKMDLSTGRAIVSRKVDCWMTYEEYCRLTSEYAAYYKKLHGYVNENAFWPGQLLDKIKVHMPNHENTRSSNIFFQNVSQGKRHNPEYYHKEIWPQSNEGYIKYGDITMHARRY